MKGDVGGKSSSADEDGGESMGVGRDAIGILLHAYSNSYNASLLTHAS